MPLPMNLNLAQAKRKIVNENLFEYADTGTGGKVALLPTPEESKVVRLIEPEILLADPVFRPKADKVFSQTPKAGTMIARGTKVNLVLVAREAGTVEMLDKAHLDLSGIRLVDVYDRFLREDPQVATVVDKFARGEEITPTERQFVETKFADEQVSIVQGQAGRDFEAGMQVLAGAALFAGVETRIQ